MAFLKLYHLQQEAASYFTLLHEISELASLSPSFFLFHSSYDILLNASSFSSSYFIRIIQLGTRFGIVYTNKVCIILKFLFKDFFY